MAFPSHDPEGGEGIDPEPGVQVPVLVSPQTYNYFFYFCFVVSHSARVFSRGGNAMRPPKDHETVRCPEGSTAIHKPEKVWDDGTYGILKEHRHGVLSGRCPYSGFPVKIECGEKKT